MNQPPAAIVWLTGLSGAGKSTIAQGAMRSLQMLNVASTVIDGDVLRHSICRDLGYSEVDRRENIRRAGELAIGKAQEGFVVFVALISPFDDARRAVRSRCGETEIAYALVYLDASVECCETRDPKGLYRLARSGALPDFTGITSPYEPPQDANLVVHTAEEQARESIDRVVNLALSITAIDPAHWAML